MNQKFVSKSNYVLRKILQKKENIDIIQDFIETFLTIEIEKIHLNPYIKSKEKYLPKEENFGICDMRVYLKDNRQFNLGIQFIDGMYVQSKMLLYYAQIHTNQIEYKEYKEIAPTITINLLDFNYFNTKEYHHKIKIPQEKLEEIEPKYIELEVIELPKYKITGEITDKKDAWMNYLIGSNIEKVTTKFDKIAKLDKALNNYWEKEVME